VPGSSGDWPRTTRAGGADRDGIGAAGCGRAAGANAGGLPSRGGEANCEGIRIGARPNWGGHPVGPQPAPSLGGAAIHKVRTADEASMSRSASLRMDGLPPGRRCRRSPVTGRPLRDVAVAGMGLRVVTGATDRGRNNRVWSERAGGDHSRCPQAQKGQLRRMQKLQPAK
jgi:hypothetical protein